MVYRTGALAILLLLTSGMRLWAAVELVNEKIRAQFDDRGLTSIRGAVERRRTSDAFSATLDGRTIESEKLPKPAMTRDGSSVRYRFNGGGFAVEVVYELQPSWNFVSKQLRIQASSAKPFHVGRVSVFRMGLADPVKQDYVCSHPSERLGTRDCGGFLRFDDGRGLLALVQNPFLKFERDRRSFEISYEPDLDWNPAWGAFESDRGVLAPYTLSGRLLPAEMIPEWKLAQNQPAPGMDVAEVEAFQGTVRAFLLDRHPAPVNVFVGWCVNDYQIDISTPDGRAEYKRVIDRAAEHGGRARTVRTRKYGHLPARAEH